MIPNFTSRPGVSRSVRNFRPVIAVFTGGMRNVSVLIALAILLAGGSTASAAPVAANTTTPPKAEKAIPYPLDFCLISGEKFAGSGMTPHAFVYNGQTIQLCCKSCLKDFNKDPKKQLVRLADEVTKLNKARANPTKP